MRSLQTASHRLTPKGGINLVQTVLDRYLLCGCADGAIRFYDFQASFRSYFEPTLPTERVQFRVVAWFEDIRAGSVMAVSFADSSLRPAQAATEAGMCFAFSSVSLCSRFESSSYRIHPISPPPPSSLLLVALAQRPHRRSSKCPISSWLPHKAKLCS